MIHQTNKGSHLRITSLIKLNNKKIVKNKIEKAQLSAYQSPFTIYNPCFLLPLLAYRMMGSSLIVVGITDTPLP